MYISHKTKTLYSGDKAHWRDVPVEIERPDQYHSPVLESTDDKFGSMKHTGWEVTPEGLERKKQDLRNELEAIDVKYHTIRAIREFIINNPDWFSVEAVKLMEKAEAEAQEIRDKLK
ncbi:MAG: hypothetical protein R6U98_00615 [Pirellulaceae bacterium]